MDVLNTKGGSAVSPSGKLDLDANAPLRVVKGSILLSLAGAATGASIGVLRAQPGTLLGMQMGTNCFIFGFPFFAIREYIIAPLLDTDPRLFSALPASVSSASKIPPPIRDASFSYYSPLSHNVLESGLSGAVVGAALAAWRGSPSSGSKGNSSGSASGQVKESLKQFGKGASSSATAASATSAASRSSVGRLAFSGFVIFGLGSATGQFAMNGIRKGLWYLFSKGVPRSSGVKRPLPPPQDKGNVVGEYFRSIDSTGQANLMPREEAPTGSSTTNAGSQSPQNTGWFSSLSSKLSSLSPVKKLDDAEYEDKLRKRLEEVQKQEQQLASEWQQLQQKPGESAGDAGSA